MARTCELPIRDGKVACPYKGLVDVEHCYRCRQLRAFVDEESGTKLICATPLGVVDGLVAALGAAKRRYRT